MDRAPYLMDGGRWGYRMGPAEILDSMLTDGLNDAFSGQHSGWHTEDLVTKLQITRADQDAFAARSQQRFAAAREAGHFAAEIVPVEIKGRKGTETFARDEAPRPDTTVETLARLKPAFRPDGTITAGNAPGLNSAAAAMIVAERGFAEANGIEPMARLAGYGVAAVEPGMFGLGPVPAVRKALDRAGWSLSDIERIEINEAFAAVPIAVARELGLPEDIVNVEGGAVAHGHPIGATGAILTTRLLHAMKRDGISAGHRHALHRWRTGHRPGVRGPLTGADIHGQRVVAAVTGPATVGANSLAQQVAALGQGLAYLAHGRTGGLVPALPRPSPLLSQTEAALGRVAGLRRGFTQGCRFALGRIALRVRRFRSAGDRRRGAGRPTSGTPCGTRPGRNSPLPRLCGPPGSASAPAPRVPWRHGPAEGIRSGDDRSRR